MLMGLLIGCYKLKAIILIIVNTSIYALFKNSSLL